MVDVNEIELQTVTERETYNRMDIGFRAKYTTSLTFEEFEKLKEAARLLGLDPLVNTYNEITERLSRFK